jgi:hypothetical protein
MIVGLTKNGKSCLFNYILGRPMIGVADPNHSQRTVYAPPPGAHKESYAQMGSNYTSVTLFPNASLHNNIYLLDMAGF